MFGGLVEVKQSCNVITVCNCKNADGELFVFVEEKSK